MLDTADLQQVQVTGEGERNKETAFDRAQNLISKAKRIEVSIGKAHLIDYNGLYGLSDKLSANIQQEITKMGKMNKEMDKYQQEVDGIQRVLETQENKNNKTLRIKKKGLEARQNKILD